MADEEEFEFEIDVRVDPRPIKIGKDKYYLVPEIMSPEYVGTFSSFEKQQKDVTEKYERKGKEELKDSKNLYQDEEAWKKAVAENIAKDPEYLKEVREVMKGMISKFMTNESSPSFLEKNYPDRVYATLINKIVRIYTNRPPTSENELGGN